jgi:Zn-dependent protease
MFGIPQPSAYDLNFRLFGIPLRITPIFWIMTIVLGWGDGNPQNVAVWVGCVFLSITVHEMGHALTNKLFGLRSIVVLHGLGGVCATEERQISSWKRVLVLFNGPFAGFLLAGLVYLTVRANAAGALLPGVPLQSGIPSEIISDLLFINIVWGVLNLIPIWPLDGGQIMGVFMRKLSQRRGMEFMHGMSMLVAALIGIWLYQRGGDIYNIFLLGLIGFQNFQMLQLMHARQVNYSDEEEWWRK